MEADPEAPSENYASISHLLLHVQSATISRLRLVLDNLSEHVSFVEGRVKDWNSIERNYLGRPQLPPDEISLLDYTGEIDDLVGCRVVVFYDSSIDIVVEHVLQNSAALGLGNTCRLWNSLTTRDVERGSKFGYRAAHITGRVSELNIAPLQFPEGVPVEIQVRTLFSDVWARHSHRAIYKGNASDTVKRKFDVLAATMEGLDEMVEMIADLSRVDVDATPLSEELAWTEAVDSFLELTGLDLDQADLDALFVSYSVSTPDAKRRDFERDVREAWDNVSHIDFRHFNVVDDALKLRIALFAHDNRRFSHIIPLSRRALVKAILEIDATSKERLHRPA